MSHGAVPGIERIVLVGFMGAGKTTVGRRLADRLEWPFIDLDAAIAERVGRSPGRLIRERGEPAFRRLEEELTAELAGRGQMVLAPGGGWVTRPALAERLGPGTVRIWLRVAPEEAVRRAESDPVDRPLLGPEEGRIERAEALLAERDRYYRMAEIAVDVDDKTPAQVVEDILRALGQDREDDER